MFLSRVGNEGFLPIFDESELAWSQALVVFDAQIDVIDVGSQALACLLQERAVFHGTY